MMATQLFIVTREAKTDLRYGIAKTIMPVFHDLEQQGWRCHYHNQTDYQAEIQQRREFWNRWFTRCRISFKSQFRQVFLAWLERYYVIDMLMKRIGSLNPQEVLVHLHDPWLAILFYGRMSTQKRQQISWGVTCHGYGAFTKAVSLDGLSIAGWLLRRLLTLEAWILKRANWVIFPSSSAYQQACHDLSLVEAQLKQRVSIIGPALAPSTSIHLSREQARGRLGWTKEKKYLIAVGRFSPVKQLDQLIRVFAKLHSDHADWQLVLLGEGDSGELERLIHDLRLQGCVAMQASDDPWLYYRASDVYVSVSRSESFGLANLEAAFAELPAICTAVGAVPEIMGSAALLVRDDESDLYQGLKQLFEDSSIREYYQSQARAWTALYPSALQINQRYVDIYQKALSKKQAS